MLISLFNVDHFRSDNLEWINKYSCLTRWFYYIEGEIVHSKKLTATYTLVNLNCKAVEYEISKFNKENKTKEIKVLSDEWN